LGALALELLELLEHAAAEKAMTAKAAGSQTRRRPRRVGVGPAGAAASGSCEIISSPLG
jgi:hypothetical protein